MPRHVHRARRPLRRRVPTVVGALLVALLGGTPIAVAVVSQGEGSAPSDQTATADTAAADVPAPTPRERRTPEPVRRDVQAVHEAGPAIAPKPDDPDDSAEELAREAGRAAKKAAPEEKADEPEPAPFDLRIGSFNVLGSQHTAPGGDRRNFPPASTRSAAAANLMAKHGVDIVGTQELQTDQLQAIQGRTGMSAYPGMAWGSAETDNSILYDPDQFEFVSGSKFIIPFMGRPRPQPILRLRDRATGREFYVVNTHPSAHDGRYLVERRRGQATLVSIVNQLKDSGLPVFVTGDMNDREEFYCRVVPPAGLVASNGGSYAGGCHPPPSPIPVDWVVGSGVTWSGYWRDTTPINQRTSDHFFISATAHVG